MQKCVSVPFGNMDIGTMREKVFESRRISIEAVSDAIENRRIKDIGRPEIGVGTAGQQ